jgi:hypothetical protein
MKDNTPFLISGRQRPNSPGSVSPQRYQFLSLKDAEPNLGVPLTNALPASATWVLTTDSNGNRYFATTILSDSTYTTLKNTSGNYVSVFNTVQSNSGKWESTYTTLNTNSGTWLTVSSASSLYFKSSGGDLLGSVNLFGNLLIYGSLSALSGLEFITTKATTTSSLSIINIGIGPALYVEQDGFFDIARFVDKEGGIVLNVGNVTPPAPGAVGGVVGIRTDKPNHTLTVVGTFSASSDVYTSGVIISAGVPLDTIIFNANNATLKSVYSTVSSNSAKWESSYAYLNSISGGLVTFQSLSTTPVILSAANILGNVNIFGNLFAAGSAYFANTIITTTSALSVINSGPGPALFVSQGKGAGDIASFYDADNSKEVFHIGNATDTFGNDVDGVIGIKTSIPNKTLTVVGEISSTGAINDLTVNYTQGNVILGKNTTILSYGFDNVFIGRDTALNNSFGVYNVFIGARAGQSNTLGNNNTFVGQNAGQTHSTGAGNSIFGSQAGPSLQTGSSNSIVGNAAASNLTLGSNNIFIGDNAGSNVITSNYNILIGQSAGAQGGDWSRTLVIGNGAKPSKDFQAVIGDPIFPFVEGIYYGNMAFYGTLSAANTTTTLLSSVTATFNSLLVKEGATIRGSATILGNTTINSNLSSLDGTVKIVGNQTITGALSVTTLSATNIVGFYSLLPYQLFTGNGVQTDFVLLSAARSVNDIMVFVSGVYQSKTYFTLITPNLLRFSTPPPNSSQIEVVYQKPSQIPYSILPLPADGTIQTSMLANRIVNSDKLAFDAVSGINIGVKQITPDKLSQGGPGWNYNYTVNQNSLSANNLNVTNLFTTVSAALSSLSAQNVIQATTLLAMSSFVLPSFGITNRGIRQRGSTRYNTDIGTYEAYYPFELGSSASGQMTPGWFGQGQQLIHSSRLTTNWTTANIIWGSTSNALYHNFLGYRIEAFFARGSQNMRLFFKFIGATGLVDTGNNYWTGGQWSNNNNGNGQIFNNVQGNGNTGIGYGMGSIYWSDSNYWWAGAGNTGMTHIMDIRTNGYSSGHWQGKVSCYHQTSYAYGASCNWHVQYGNPVSTTYNSTTVWPIIGIQYGWQEGSIPAYAGKGGNARINVYGVPGWELEQNYE